ncbi:MAG: hypothetical protein K8H88_03805 [Sandaracinaceae bacterium]|nr:hypothetical protein [Sandaracinaceae bacterium]
MPRSLLLVVSLAALLASPVRAEGPYEGQWREGPMSIDVQVVSWGGDCGPRPQSTSAGGGGTFNITQSGDQLTFHLRREQTTRSCWSENRAVRRVSSSYQSGTWRIVCRTPAEDSRSETGTYTLQALGEDRLQFRDVSQYDWQLNESRCLATITTTQSFTRVAGTTPTPATPTPEPERPRCTAGEPARVILRPTEAEVEPGGEICFTARAVDAAGCAVQRRITLQIASGAGQMRGSCYHAGAEAGSAQVRASLGELGAEARVTVRTFDLSDLIARRSETGSVGSGAPEDASADTAARVSARAVDGGRSMLWAIGGGGAGLVVVVALAALLLSRKKRKKSSKRARRPPPEATPMDEPERAPPRADSSDRICPTCRRGYPPGEERCPHDGATLVPYAEFLASQPKENVCPACGERYPAHVRFCGKDGTTLESSD